MVTDRLLREQLLSLLRGGNAHMTGSLKLDRTAFHLGEGAWQDHSVDPKVTVSVALTAHRAG